MRSSLGADFATDSTTRRSLQDLIESFDAELLRNPSATLTLERWCAAHFPPPRHQIRAVGQKAEMPPIDPALLDNLSVRHGAMLRYRRVRLCYGDLVLSEADNWYVPSRLTDDMNRQLEETETSFGRVAKPLNYSRRTLSHDVLWSPLDSRLGADHAMPRAILAHRALLLLPDGTPISEVHETYLSSLFAVIED